MNVTKILWGQVLLGGFVVLAFVWGATEWVAWRLEFQSQLGRPWFEIFGWPLYQPPAWRCHILGGLVAKEHDENQLLRISVPSGDHSPGDLALSPVHA